MRNEDYSGRSGDSSKPYRQRALVLQGGGTFGTYEAGVLEVLCKKLAEDDKESNVEDRLLFDIVAGTSIGAMNGAILVSQFLETQSWEKAAEKLQKFWTNRLSVKCLDISEISKPWYNQWIKRISTAASEEAARRYYSVRKLLLNQLRNNMYYQCDQMIEDNKFFDHSFLGKDPNFLHNDWILHSTKPLQESIQKYVKFPISTTFHDKNEQKHRQQPRLLVFSVDVAEGVTVTFDSYPKADGSRKSEYGKYTLGKGYENVISYDHGINIEHIMASGTLPEFYYYARVPTIEIEQNDEDKRCMTYKNKDNNIMTMQGFYCEGLSTITILS